VAAAAPAAAERAKLMPGGRRGCSVAALLRDACFGTESAQTRDTFVGIVDLEGGGYEPHPGGGMGRAAGRPADVSTNSDHGGRR
jgi:hypothetical protein